MNLRPGFRSLLAAATLASILATPALAAGESAGLNRLAGYVFYTSGASVSPGYAYLSVRRGDLFDVAAGVVLKVVYLHSGRQEIFSHPTSFAVGTRQSAVRRGVRPRVNVPPVDVPPAQRQAEVREARETYAKLRAESSADDITPELYLFCVLQDNLLYSEMKTLVTQMAIRRPGNSDVEGLLEYVRLKTEPR